jgi:hypothetical protein
MKQLPPGEQESVTIPLDLGKAKKIWKWLFKRKDKPDVRIADLERSEAPGRDSEGES